MSIEWEKARACAYEAGRAAAGPVQQVPLATADGRTLAEPLLALTDLPAFPTASIDGWAVRGPAPWRVTGRILAGSPAAPLTEDGTCAEIATGAMVPAGAEALIRIEDSERDADGLVTGAPRSTPEWRLPGEEAHRGEELLPAGTAIDPAVIGLAATCGYETIAARPQPQIDEAAIVDMLQKMVRQRQESIELYKQGNRQELADKEQAEIDLIERYLPKKLSDQEQADAIAKAIADTGAASIKDMGKVMAALKAGYAGQMDFSKVGPALKAKLGG